MSAELPPEQVQAISSWSKALAINAATYCAPIVAMYNLRYSIAFAPTARAKPGEIWRFADIATPAIAEQSGYVTPNVNVLYGFGFVDLRRGPVILSVPNSNGRYYMVEIVDMWTNAFAYAGGLATGYQGGKFALVAPRWQGTLPPGVTRIDAPTPWIELQPRVFVKNEADIPGAKAVLNQITLAPLAQDQLGTTSYNYPAPNLEPGIASSRMPFKDSLQFWTICSAAMNENPPPQAQSNSVLPQYKYLGLALGKQWTPQSPTNSIVLEQMKEAANQIAGIAVNSTALVGTIKNGWTIPPANQGNAGPDYPSRAIVAIIGLTANTSKEAIYYTGIVDNSGQPLSGAKKYMIRFAGDLTSITPIPPGFWSVTMYDAKSAYTVSNPISRYSLGSSDNFKKNPDGSYTMYIQHDNPGPERQSNWLPAPVGPFYLILRNYAPVPAASEGLRDPGTFTAPPPIVAVP